MTSKDKQPAVTVGVPADIRDYAIDVSEAYDTMMEVERNPAGAWQVIQALAGHIAALEPVTPAPYADDSYPHDAIEQCERDLDGVDVEAAPDAAAIREAALMTVPDEIELYYIIKASGATKRIDVARAVSTHLEPTRRAILALTTEKPHDRA